MDLLQAGFRFASILPYPEFPHHMLPVPGGVFSAHAFDGDACKMKKTAVRFIHDVVPVVLHSIRNARAPLFDFHSLKDVFMISRFNTVYVLDRWPDGSPPGTAYGGWAAVGSLIALFKNIPAAAAFSLRFLSSLAAPKRSAQRLLSCQPCGSGIQGEQGASAPGSPLRWKNPA